MGRQGKVLTNAIVVIDAQQIRAITTMLPQFPLAPKPSISPNTPDFPA